jgi:hypothetical protein
MNDNIPYYDGLVGTLQLKRCTIHHLRYTLYHRTNALAAACPKSQSASVDITQSGSRWRGRSQLCSANLYPRPRIPSDSSQQQHFPPRGCHGGRGFRVKGATSRSSYFTLLHQPLFPPFLPPIISSTRQRTDTHPLKSTLFRHQTKHPDSLSRNPQETTRTEHKHASHLVHDVHEIRHHRPLCARRHCQPGRWTDSERYGR